MGLVFKALKGTAKGAAKVNNVVGPVTGKIVEGLGAGAIAATAGTGMAISKVSKSKVGKLTKRALVKDISAEALKDASLYERLAGKKLTGVGVGALVAGTMGVSTINAVADNGLSKFQKLGDVSVGENLDRLVSYDGSGFINNINNVAGGNSEVMQDIIKNSFDNINQVGVSGDIVFALHNMREG